MPASARLNLGTPQKGIQIYMSSLNQTANVFFLLRTENFEMILSITKQMPSAVFNIILFIQAPIGSPLRDIEPILSSRQQLSRRLYGRGANLCCRVSPFPNQWSFWWEARKPHHRVGMRPRLHSAIETRNDDRNANLNPEINLILQSTFKVKHKRVRNDLND